MSSGAYGLLCLSGCESHKDKLKLIYMKKYHQILKKITEKGKVQLNNKGNITYLLNQKIELKPCDLLDLFEVIQWPKISSKMN